MPTEPTPAEPVATEPTPAEPVATEPVATEPVPAEPVPAEPVATEPVPGTRAEAITAFHAALDGPSWRVAGWGSPDLQRTRFEALTRNADYRGGTVLDWGCGPGDLYLHLRHLDLPLHYTGIDQDPRMVALAESRGVPNVTVQPLGRPPEGTHDYVFASGIFQFADPSDPLYYLDILEQAYDISARAVAVNFLSVHRPEAATAGDELYADPAVLSRFAAALTNRWRIDHAYHPQAADFTLALLKNPSG